MKTTIVIPARYGSARLPGKPLVDILGKPMIQHVMERAQQVANAHRVVVATDDSRVASVVRDFGGEAIMTSVDHASGTDRLVEVMSRIHADLYVNLQGDEPLIRPEDVTRLIDGMHARPDVDVGSLCHALDATEAKNINAVKVVLDDKGQAMYFSRSPIPFERAAGSASYLKHVGVYAYRRATLERYGTLASPMTERAEMLEQLRLLHAGVRMQMFDVAPTAPGVDTPQCLERVRAMMAEHWRRAESASSSLSVERQRQAPPGARR